MAGTDIVCLHGLGRLESDWDSVRDELSAWGKVRAPDLRRVGRAEAVSIGELRPRTILVGHSLGAVLALRLASGSPSVRGLVMTGGFYPPGRNDQSYANALGGYARHRVAVAKTLVAQGARPRRGGVRALTSLAAMGLRPARFHRLAAGVRVPVLVVHGDADHHVPVDFMIAATRRYSSWNVHVVAGGGHHLHVDQADEWLTITTRWLRHLE